MPEYRHGALYVVEDGANHRDIERHLKDVDPRLFLERQVSFDNEMVWCVVTDIGGDHPPLTILEWRDEFDRPIPELTSSIVERVKRIDRDPIILAKKIQDRNDARRRALDKRRDEAIEEMARDMIPRIEGKVRPVLHRSVALRMSRDKRRSRGEIR